MMRSAFATYQPACTLRTHLHLSHFTLLTEFNIHRAKKEEENMCGVCSGVAGFGVGRCDVQPNATVRDAGRKVEVGTRRCEYSVASRQATKNDSRNEDNDVNREMSADTTIAETGAVRFSMERVSMLQSLAESTERRGASEHFEPAELKLTASLLGDVRDHHRCKGRTLDRVDTLHLMHRSLISTRRVCSIHIAQT